jgi:hypothetical protein
MRSLWSVFLTKCYSGGQIEKNEMGGTCSTYWGEQRCVLVFGGEVDYLENPGVDGRIILRWIFKKLNRRHGWV